MKILSSHYLLLSLVIAFPWPAAFADVKLPSLISDHMVLQKSDNVPIWGTAVPFEEVTVKLNDQMIRTQADDKGKWKVRLNLSQSAQGPFEMVVSGKNEIKIADVLIGEVWLASGQSNMELVLKDTIEAEKEIAQSANPLLREFHVKICSSPEPLEDCEGVWKVAGPDTAGGFSGVGYYFSKKLQHELKTPVGVIHSSLGATPVEAWTSRAALASVPDLKVTADRHVREAQTYTDDRKKFLVEFGAWLKAAGREDRPGVNSSAFAGRDVATSSWIPVLLPGKVAATGLPEAGAIWLRRQYDVPAGQAHQDLILDLGDITGFESVYWNGELIGGTSWEKYPGRGFLRQDKVPAKLVLEGANTLALRIFAPTGPPVFTVNLQHIPGALMGDWFARAEYELPSLDAAGRSSVPLAPIVPQIPRKLSSFNFNGMIHPLLPYAIRGAIWYQGEGNVSRAYQYRTAFPLLIEDWRKQWGRGDFPFYFCQLANFHEKKAEPGDNDQAELREAQNLTLQVSQTGQVVLIDVGEAKDIHPRNKKDVGERLALIALAKDYQKPVAYSGPVYESMKIEAGKIRLKFKHADQGLQAKPLPAVYDVRTLNHSTAPVVRNSPQSQLEGFAICGADHKWVWAEAKIEGDDVVVWAEGVHEPVAVRYAWADNPTCNLYNGAGLPASPFRTDSFPVLTQQVIDW